MPPSFPFSNIAVIGIGLIGASIIHAAKHRQLPVSFTAYDNQPDVRGQATDLLPHAKITSSLQQAVADAELVFLAVPVGVMEQVMKDMNWEKEKQVVKINNMWAIINTGGAANHRHQHSNCTISGAYYVRAPKNSGDIIFYDPRPAPVYTYPNAVNPNLLNAQVNGISPKEGALVLFPSYLDHSVNENLSNEERIVISFNITIQSKSN